jgi:pyrimidine-nucleoside phosphorylase
MDQPLGNAVGNALELREAIEMLHGVGPEDYRYHCLHLAAYMLILGQKAADIETGLAMAERAIQDGSGLRKFRELVIAQHGDVSTIDNLDKLPKAKFIEPVLAEKSGWVNSVNAREVGETSVQLGAGREKKGDPIDPAVGIMVYAKIGDAIEAGQTLFEIHANNAGKLLQAKERLKNAIEITQDRVERPPYFHGVIGL